MATEHANDDDDQQQHGVFDDETMRMLSANLPDKIFRAPDPRIQMAAMEAERTNQMTPVLKEELRLRILAKRLERGEPDIETTHTPKTYELTEEEKKKRERRKEQNRRAAKKCREKRKLKSLDVHENFENLNEENEKLNKEIVYRRKQREQLMDFIKEHIIGGKCKLLGAHHSKTTSSNECSSGINPNATSADQLRVFTRTPPPITPPSPGTISSHSCAPSTSTSLPKLSVCIPEYNNNQLTNNSTTNNSNNNDTIYQILQQEHSGNQHNQIQVHIPNISQSQIQQQEFQHLISSYQFSNVTSSTSNQPTTSQYHQSFTITNQQQHQQHSFDEYTTTSTITTTNNNVNHINMSTTNTNAIQQQTLLSPKPGQPPRPVISRTPSTTTPNPSPFPPPQSPCSSGHQISCISSVTLTPPPSVSSEQYFVPESPSILTTSTTTTTNTSSVPIDNMIRIQCVTPSSSLSSSSAVPMDQNILTPPIIYPPFPSINGLTYHQLSPANSLSGESPPNLNIMTDQMFDDEDDEDNDDDENNNWRHILDSLQ